MQLYIGQSGGANRLLHYGAQVTNQLGARLGFDIDKTLSWYGVRLSEAPIDTLIFAEEYLESTPKVQQTQIILATQSCTFVDHFDPSDVVVVEQKQGESSFKRLEPDLM